MLIIGDDVFGVVGRIENFDERALLVFVEIDIFS